MAVITKSPGVKEAQDLKKIKDWHSDGAQAKFMMYYLSKFNAARDQRAKNRVELDNNNYENDYELNKRAANSYLYPKNNDDEVRVVTTATEKKIEVVENELMAANFQGEIFAYDDNDRMMRQLGQDITDVVDRTNEMERDDKVWRAFIKEFTTQRCAFLEEVNFYDIILNCPYSQLGDDGKVDPIRGAPKKEVIHRPIKRLVSGLRIYLGDDSIPAYRFHEQPYIIRYTRMKFSTAKDQYQKWENWKFVKPGIPENISKPYGYRMNTLTSDEVEEIMYIDPHKNEFMIIINGVPMFNEAVPCPWKITADRKYMMEMMVLKGIGDDYAYGRPLTATSKMLQSLNDETIRLLIRKMRQAIEPPIGTKKKKIFSKDIWSPGAVTQGIGKGDFEILNPENKGVTGSEFNMMSLFNGAIEEAIGTPDSAQGLSQSGEQTATEIVNQQKRFAKMLGQALLTMEYAKQQMTYQRIYNLMDNFMGPVKRKVNPINNKVQDIFRRFTIDNASFENGRRGTKIVEFMDRDIEPVEKEAMFEFEQREESLGRPTRIRAINVKKMKEFPLFFKVVVNQRERDGSALEKAMYTDKIKQAVSISQLTGTPLNSDEIISDFELIWKTSNLFQRGAQPGGNNTESEEAQQLKQRISEAEGQSEIGDQLKESAGQEANKPSLNTIQSNVQ